MARIKHVLHVRGYDQPREFSSIDFGSLSASHFSHKKVGNFHTGVSLEEVSQAAGLLTERGHTMVMLHVHGDIYDDKHFLGLGSKAPTPTAQLFDALARSSGVKPIDVFFNCCFSNRAQADRNLLPQGSSVITRSDKIVWMNFSPVPGASQDLGASTTRFFPIIKRRKEKTASLHPRPREMVASSLNCIPEGAKANAESVAISYLINSADIERDEHPNNYPIFGIAGGQQIDVAAEVQERRKTGFSPKEWRRVADKLAGHVELGKGQGTDSRVTAIVKAWEIPEYDISKYDEGMAMAIAFAAADKEKPSRSMPKSNAKGLDCAA